MPLISCFYIEIPLKIFRHVNERIKIMFFFLSNRCNYTDQESIRRCRNDARRTRMRELGFQQRLVFAQFGPRQACRAPDNRSGGARRFEHKQRFLVWHGYMCMYVSDQKKLSVRETTTSRKMSARFNQKSRALLSKKNFLQKIKFLKNRRINQNWRARIL